MPPDQNRRMMIQVADPRFPYETPQDFVRDAIVHRLAMLAEVSDDAKELLNVMLIDAKAGEMVARMEASEQLVEKYRLVAQRMTTPEERTVLADEIYNIVAESDKLGMHAVDVRQLESLVDRLRAF